MMKEPKNLRAGVIGLGMIGGGVATSLIKNNRNPAVYDVIPDAAKKRNLIVEQLVSPSEVAAVSDIIMIAVFNYEQCKEVIMGKNGLLKNAHKDSVFVILSTISLDEIKELHSICKAKGVSLLDCGVTPGTLADKNGLIAMVGGDKEVYEYAKPILDDWSGESIYCGPSGAGMACKIARNINTYGIWRITTEAFRLALAAGTDPATYLHVLETADKVDNLFYKMLHVRASQPDYRLPESMSRVAEYMEKDLNASKQLSDSLGLALPTRDNLMEYCLDTFDANDRILVLVPTSPMQESKE